jgi:DNA/RNA endonuclease YhcR with UshA esterase domain
MTAPILMHGSETWVHSQKEMNKIQAAEMRFLRKTKGCTRLDRTRNENIRAQLNICSIFGRITNYRNRWKVHINRMEDHRLPKQITKYKPMGKYMLIDP